MADVEGAAGGPQSSRVVAGMGRAELEDRYLSFVEENLLLKKHARSQEEKMKKMATKLLRLAADERKEAKRGGQPPSVVQVRELEGEVQELLSRIRDLERTNSSLHNKVVVLRQLSESQGKRKTAYDHVQSRISSGLRRQGQRSVSTEDISIRRRNVSALSSPTTPRYGRSLLEEARRDNQQLEELVLKLKQEVSVLTAQAERNQEQRRLEAAEQEQERLSLQHQLQTRLTVEQKRGIEEDVEVIRVQRELRDKSSRLLSLQTQYSTLERSLGAMRTSHSKLLQEIELLSSRLKEEQSHSVELQGRLHSSSVSQRTVLELQEMVDDLRAEKDLLKKANDRFMKSALAGDRGEEYRGQVRALQERVRELEASHQTHLTAKEHSLSSGREVSERLERELRETREAYHLLQSQHRQLQTRLQSQEGGGSRGDIKSVARGVERRMEEENEEEESGRGRDHSAAAAASAVAPDPLSFLEKLDQNGKSDLRREVSELRLAHADTAAELEKTRQLLSAQRAINQDYHREVKALTDQVSQLQSEYSVQLSEQARLLDVRAARVRQPDTQRRDLAYSTTASTGKDRQHSSPLCGTPPISPPPPQHPHSSHPFPPHTTLSSSPPPHPHRGTVTLHSTSGSSGRGKKSLEDTVDSGRLEEGDGMMGDGVGGEEKWAKGKKRDRENKKKRRRGEERLLVGQQKGGARGKHKDRAEKKDGSRKQTSNVGPGRQEETDTHEHAQYRRLNSDRPAKTKSDRPVVLSQPGKESRLEKAVGVKKEREKKERGSSPPPPQLPSLRAAGRTPLPALQEPLQHRAASQQQGSGGGGGGLEEVKDEHGRASDRHVVAEVQDKHKKNKSLEEEGEEEVEEDIEEEVSVSSSSVSDVGTPSTSTPMKLVRPPHTSGSSGQQPAPPPPLSSSLSVIAEPPSDIVQGRGGGEGGGGGGGRGERGGGVGVSRVGSGGFVVIEGGGEGVVGRGSGEEGDGDSVSVTMTEMSGEEDDTMFGDTIPQQTTESILSSTMPTPSRPSVRLAADDEGDSPFISPSLTSGEDENSITPTTPQPRSLAAKAPGDVLSITVVSFTVQPGSSLVRRSDVSGYFVEFQLLDYDYGELETPSVYTSPHSTQPVVFNFKTEFHIGPSQKALLQSLLSSTAHSSEGKVIFTVVSDPVDQEADCDEVGTAELDLSSILQRREDVVSESIEVLSGDEEAEVMGHLTVAIQAQVALQQRTKP